MSTPELFKGIYGVLKNSEFSYDDINEIMIQTQNIYLFHN